MAENKKISQLTQAINITGEELIPFVLDGQNKVVKAKYLKGADNLGEDFVDLVGDDGQEYRVKVVNGEAVAIRMDAFTAEDAEPSAENPHPLYTGLLINSMYGGGDALEGTPVSHGFIELYNFTNKEINLKGLYLFVRAKAGSWQGLALQGIVPARHSFLVRCAQHAEPFSQGVRCNILDYDMHWDIKLPDKGFSAYIQVGNDVPEDNPVRLVKDAQQVIVSQNGKYIDLLGAGGVSADDTVWAYETRYLHCMDKNTGVRRIDFSNSDTVHLKEVMKLGNNAAVSGNNDCDVEPINYKTCNMEHYRPRCVKDGRWTEFINKPKQKDTVPSMINMMYGENGDNTRTFTFQTPLTESGFVKIRKDGELNWINYETTVEIFSNVDGDVMVHRCIVEGLEPGKYEYQVGTEGCVSDNYAFEVKIFDEANPLRILWTTDQQSWTKQEYDVWQMCARFLNNKQQELEEPFDFHLNTGDISQNANRRFEWSYYYDYAKDITRNIPHVITCGNNDLIDKKYSDAFNYYITVQNQFANSVYAFDLGFTHFVCLNSNEDMTHVGEGDNQWPTKEDFLQAQADWLDAHLTEVEQREVQPRWVIVFAHLSAFTVARVKRLQRWVAPIEKHKVDMFLCGHNHAWSVSKPLYTGYDYNAYAGYNDYKTTVSGSSELKMVDEFQADGVTEINRKADIQNGTYYVLNQATGYKLSGKEKPITNLGGKAEVPENQKNADGSPWWVAAQALPTNPVYIDLQISYDQIICESYEIEGIKGSDEFKNAVINTDLSKVSEKNFNTLVINYSDRHPQE
jgi:hypothetical protein